MAPSAKHKWTFRTRFRRHAFGWRSQPAAQRVKEAVSEIKKAARNLGCETETLARIRELVAGETFGKRFVTKILGRALGLS